MLGFRRFLPPINSAGYHVLLGAATRFRARQFRYQVISITMRAVRGRARGPRAPQPARHDRARARGRHRAGDRGAAQAIKGRAAWKTWAKERHAGYYTDLALDCVVLPSPYASSFGGFVEFGTSAWFGGGSVFSSLLQTWWARQPRRPEDEDLPEDMSTMSPVGGGLIAGDSLAALGVGVWGLTRTVMDVPTAW